MNKNNIFFNKTDKIRLAGEIQQDSVVDGPGLRSVIWVQGCFHNCDGCHNPNTHSISEGNLVDVNVVLNKVLQIGQNITFSGGDPFFQPKQCAYIAEAAAKNGLNIWAYSGFTYEQLIAFENENINKFLSNIDVLVDGKFDINKKSLECKYRGSTNQRIIDVRKSINAKNVVLWNDLYEKIQKHNNDYF